MFFYVLPFKKEAGGMLYVKKYGNYYHNMLPQNAWTAYLLY